MTHFKWTTGMDSLKKYFCACECIYDLFGFPRSQQYMSVMNPNQKPSSKYVSTSRYRQSLPTIPEVIHHQPLHQKPQYIYQFANDEEPLERNVKNESTQTHNNDVHIDLENANLPEEQTYQQQQVVYSLQGHETETVHPNQMLINRPNPIKDLPHREERERDIWHIL